MSVQRKTEERRVKQRERKNYWNKECERQDRMAAAVDAYVAEHAKTENERLRSENMMLKRHVRQF